MSPQQKQLCREHGRGAHVERVVGCPACKKFPPGWAAKTQISIPAEETDRG